MKSFSICRCQADLLPLCHSPTLPEWVQGGEAILKAKEEIFVGLIDYKKKEEEESYTLSCEFKRRRTRSPSITAYAKVMSEQQRAPRGQPAAASRALNNDNEEKEYNNIMPPIQVTGHARRQGRDDNKEAEQRHHPTARQQAGHGNNRPSDSTLNHVGDSCLIFMPRLTYNTAAPLVHSPA
jgi:hypothetical protein